MSIERGDCLTIETAERVAWVTIDHPPINLFDTLLIRELAAAAARLAQDPDIGAVVIQSADPEFFVAHGDVRAILGAIDDDATRHSDSFPFQRMLDQFRTMPKATIGKVDASREAAAWSCWLRSTCASVRWRTPDWASLKLRWASFRAVVGPVAGLG